MRVLITTCFITGAVAGTALGLALHNARQIEVVPTPAIVVNVPPIVPAPVVTVAPSPPPIAAEPVEEPMVFPKTRPDTPKLWAQCVTNLGANDTECGWDDGMPAISEYGTTIAMKYIPEDGGRGNPGLYIRLIDVESGEVTETIEILDPDDYVGPDDNDAAVVKQTQTIAARIAKVQERLDEEGYRSFEKVGRFDEHDPAGDDLAVENVYAEVQPSGATRVIDPLTRKVLLQHDFSVPSPNTDNDRDGECTAWHLAQMETWWDHNAGVVLASSLYTHGGCMCGSSQVEQVVRVPSRS